MPDETPYLESDILTQLDALRAEPGWQAGHSARTLVKYAGLRIVLIAMKAGSRIPAHQTEGPIAIQALHGHIRVHADGRTFDVPARGLLTLGERVRHDVEAVDDSGFLLSIASDRSHA